MPIDRDKLIAAIDAAQENSYGTDEQSSLGSKRAKAIEAYLGLNTNPAPEGRSQVVDRTVYQTLSTIMPSLVRIFAASSDEICKCVAVGPDDEEAAEQATAVLNHVVAQINPWEQIVSDWIHDASLLGNGYALAYWDESQQRVRETYRDQSDDQLAALTQDRDVEILEHSEEIDEQSTADQALAYQEQVRQYQMAVQQWQMAAHHAQAQGRPPPMQPQPPQEQPPVKKHSVVIERSENKGKVCIQVLPPEHCYVSVDTPDWTLRQAPYFEFRQEKTIGQLRDMGLEVPDDVTDDEDIDTSDEDWARDRFDEDRDSDDNTTLRRVWARMIWVRAIVEDDGVERLYYVIAVGRTLLWAEAVPSIPVASMTPQPLPHRHPGMSIAETVIDIQETKTAVKRGGLDNLYLANNGRHVISAKVNLDDLLDSRPGGVVRMLDTMALPGEGHIVPLQHPFAFEQIVGSLEYFDQEGQNRTGASRYFSGTDANAINKTASGTIALQNMAAMRVEHIARMMAPAVERLFEVIHELISKHQNKPLSIKLRGSWVTVDPQAWRTRRDVRISVGVGAGNKEAMQAHLGALYGAQLQLVPLGLVGPEQIHATVTEMAKLAGFANPAKFWRDPRQLPPQQPQPTPEQVKAQSAMQIEQFKAQQEQMKAQAEQHLEQQRLQMQAQVDQSREEMQARQKALEAQMKAEMDQANAARQAELETAKLAMEKWKAELDATVKLQIAAMNQKPEVEDKSGEQMLHALQQLMEVVQELAQPAQIIRGPDGRAMGVQRGSRKMTIQRGPDGRAIGLQ